MWYHLKPISDAVLHTVMYCLSIGVDEQEGALPSISSLERVTESTEGLGIDLNSGTLSCHGVFWCIVVYSMDIILVYLCQYLMMYLVKKKTCE